MRVKNRFRIQASFLVLFISSSILVAGPSSMAAPEPVPQWNCNTDLKSSSDSMPVCVLAFYNSFANQASSPVVWWDKNGFSQPEPKCDDATLQTCARKWLTEGNRAGGQAVMPACQDGGSEEFCIKSLRLKSANSERILDYLGTDVRVQGADLDGDARFKVPKGGIGSYWLDPVTGDRYALSVISYYFLQIVQTSTSSSTVEARLYRTDLSITRVATLSGKNTVSESDRNRISDTVLDLDPQLTFELSVSYPEGWTGFVASRISDMGLSSSDLKGFSEVTFSGRPMQVSGSVVEAKKPSQEWNEILGANYPVGGGGSVTVVTTLSRARAFQQLSGDKASGIQTVWGLNIYPSQLQCGSEKTSFPGYSSSNGLFHASSVPNFSGGFFSFEVADFHLRADGSINRGEYYFGIDVDLAKCLYGFSKAPKSATVSVTSQDGVDSTAVTTVFEKNGMLKISATNFTYSVKTIRTQVLENSQAPAQPKKYSNCSTLNKVYKGGISKSKGSVNKGKLAKFKPTLNASLYKVNQNLDIDRDGIACER